MADPITPGAGLPLPPDADLKFWQGEIARAKSADDPYAAEWQEGIDWYAGKSKDASTALANSQEFVNVNVDFYQVEQKLAQLFYDTPDLQLTPKGALTLVPQMSGMPGMPPQPGMPANPQQAALIVSAHKTLLNELLGDDHADVLMRAVHPAIKDCLCVSGIGPVVIGYEPTLREATPPIQPGQMLGLAAPVKVPIYERWYALRFSRKKLIVPADFHSTDWDRAPFLGMRFRMPLTVAIREQLVPPDFKGTNTRDAFVLNDSERTQEVSGLNYVDGQLIFYLASVYDPEAYHPLLYRELVLIDGLEKEARHRDCPHQTILPNGRMSADSMIGNPIHPLSIRFVPDSAYTPSDAQMTRPLVRELCKFRTQMVQSRDADRQRVLYDSSKLPPEVVQKIADGTLGDLIGVEEGALAQGVASIMAEVVKGQPSRQTYVANDYITRDIEKTLAIDASGAGASDGENETATKTTVIDRNRGVRMNHEQRQVLRWYLRLVDKFSALVCRYMTPDLAAPYIGQEAAQVWAQWDKRASDGRMAFAAKPDSQIKLDAAAERKFALDIYQFLAKDPMVNRGELLKNLVTKAGLDPAQVIAGEPPQQKPDGSFSLAMKGEDLIGPQSQIVLEILAQLGVQISPEAVDTAASQLFKQIALGVRDASGKAVPPANKPAQHGGTAEKVRPLSQQSADLSGQRSGPKAEVA